MESIYGKDLTTFANRCNNKGKRLNDRFCRFIFSKILNAIFKLHQAGVAHRDIKCENILITHDFKIKIVDLGFGIPLAGRDGSSLLKTPKGTPVYAAPEILKNKPYQGTAIDIFSLGVTFFALRTMKFPFK